MRTYDPASRYAALSVDYELEEELGRGEEVTLLPARERELRREVLLKLAADDETGAVTRLRAEARILDQSQHRHLVQLLAVRRLEEEGLVIVLHRPRGRTLREELGQSGPLAAARVERMLAEIGAALAAAHARGVFHGSLTPDCIHIEAGTGTSRLWGLGDARFGDDPPTLPLAAPLDPHAWLAPERFGGAEPDARSDLYSLALVGWQALTGGGLPARPTDGLPTGAVSFDVPERLRHALDAALQVRPAARWPGVDVFLDELADRRTSAPAFDVVPPAVPPAPLLPSLSARHDRVLMPPTRAVGLWRRPALFVGGVLLVATAAFGVANWIPSADDPGPSRQATSPFVGAAPAPTPAVTPGIPVSVYAMLGAIQEGPAGVALPAPLVARVDDATGKGVAGVAVRFRILAGGGRLTADSMVTDENGLAEVGWTPAEAGVGRVEAIVSRLDGAAAFLARVLPAAPAPAASPVPLPVPAESEADAPAVAVRAGFALGGTHSCALRADGVAYCWGGNDAGQLGGSGGGAGAPVEVRAPEPLAVLAAGVTHTCAVSVSGTLYCWGGNGSGQLGVATAAGGLVPVAQGRRFTDVSSGLGHSCAITSTGGALCWGDNGRGQLGDGRRTGRSLPVSPAGGRAWRALAVGWTHTCALAVNGSAWCWGGNEHGQLGAGDLEDRSEPAAVSGGHRFTAIAAGSHHTCGLRTDGVVLCWGQNGAGQLGNGSVAPSPVPVPVAGETRFGGLALGSVHSCALDLASTAWCWGRNTYGQLGDGTQTDRHVPALAGGLIRFAALEAGGAKTCGRAAGGRDFCWGYNAFGQLGTASRTNQSRPAPVQARW